MRAGRFGRNVGAKDIIDIERPRPGRRKRLVVMKSEKDINKLFDYLAPTILVNY